MTTLNRYLIGILTGMLAILLHTTCSKDTIAVDLSGTGYPDAVGSLLLKNCAVSGCHNSQSKDACGGLSLETWENLMEGGSSGSVVVPFRPDFSTLMYYTNSYDEFGSIQLTPKMPVGGNALSKPEMKILNDWILAGAPNRKGFVKFSDYENREKIYVVNNGCDVVAILDPETERTMRYVSVGISPAIEGPTMVKVAPDQKHWYVIFGGGTVIQKFRTSDNKVTGHINIGSGVWTSFAISPDSRRAYITDIQFDGKIVCVDLENLQVIATLSTGWRYPFDIAVDHTGNILYAVPNLGNFLYKINITNINNPVIAELSMEQGYPVNYSSSLDPYSIQFNANQSKYFVVCRGSSELRIFQTGNDSLLAVIPVGTKASRMAISQQTPYLFVSCEGAYPSRESAIYVVNHQTNSYVTDVYAGFDSRGIVLSDATGMIYVANRNVSSGGPAAHHESVCSGKNGYLTALDIMNHQLIPGYRVEVSVDPLYIGKSH